jgi:hypothetical protein
MAGSGYIGGFCEPNPFSFFEVAAPPARKRR